MIRRLGNQQLMNKGLVPRGTQEDEPWRKVARGLSAWYKGISQFRENDKRECNQKVGLKRWNLEVLEKERSKVSLLGPPRTESQLRAFEEGTSKEGNSEEWGRD